MTGGNKAEFGARRHRVITMKIEITKCHEIKTVDDWHQYAPPQNPEKQWKDGRSAKLFAEYALSQCFAENMHKILSYYGFQTSKVLSCEPEVNTKLPYGSKGRQHDLLIDGKDFIVGIEAKVSESFGKSIEEEYTKSKGKRDRIKSLLAYIGKDYEEAKDCKYQLLTGLVGTLLEAKERGKEKCLFLVIVFSGDVTATQKEQIKNNEDYSYFCNSLLEQADGSGKKYSIEDTEITCYIKKVEVKVESKSFLLTN